MQKVIEVVAAIDPVASCEARRAVLAGPLAAEPGSSVVVGLVEP